MSEPQFHLTVLAHGGGCGCKLHPPVLQQLPAVQAAAAQFALLPVSTEIVDRPSRKKSVSFDALQ
jgi:selenophosphate synthase